MTTQEYKENPCGLLSIPYWKNKRVRVPDNLRIVHGRDYRPIDFPEYHDEPYFRLYHTLENVQPITVEGISLVSAGYDAIPVFVDVINRSYTDLSVTLEQMQSYTQTEAFCPELWVVAVENATGCVVGCGIADLDTELREGILEWLQVLPAYRGRKIGQLIVNELLKRMANVAEFATVSGRCNDATNPEILYRKCGFTGNDVWHILTK